MSTPEAIRHGVVENGSKRHHTTRWGEHPCSEPLPRKRTAGDPPSGHRGYVPGRLSAPQVRKAGLPCSCRQLGTHLQGTVGYDPGRVSAPQVRKAGLPCPCRQLGNHPQDTVGCAPRRLCWAGHAAPMPPADAGLRHRLGRECRRSSHYGL